MAETVADLKESEEFLELPLEDIKNSCGLALDIGGSLGKLAYRSKEDFTNGEPPKPYHKEGFGQLRLKSFLRNNIDEIISFISEKCDLTRNEQGDIECPMTGFGGNEYSQKIEEGLSVKLKKQNEINMYVKGFCHLAKSEGSESLLSVNEDGTAAGMQFMMEMAKYTVGMKKHSDTKEAFESTGNEMAETPGGKIQFKFPCLLVLSGSGLLIFKVEEDGSFTITGGSTFGGRMFIGLSRLLTGVQDFDTLIDMASEATGETTDICAKQLKMHGCEDMYSVMPDDMLVYSFGQGTSKDIGDCKKEDLVLSTFNVVMLSAVYDIRSYARAYDTSNVYLCGNFVRSDFVQKHMTKHLLIANMMNAHKCKEPLNFGFVKHGGFIAAIGAYLSKN